ncbi:hypothetical protein WMY93_015059 [Mugilogobius chulae]|uniref:Uncharacterized protein n=1 Tax=Mugilogobius chulae TaxID=88201 RepID=A0AAW0P2Z4_9GOBI
MENSEDNGGLKLSTPGERRPSVEALHKMLKRVSQSPFHNQNQSDLGTMDKHLSAASQVEEHVTCLLKIIIVFVNVQFSGLAFVPCHSPPPPPLLLLSSDDVSICFEKPESTNCPEENSSKPSADPVKPDAFFIPPPDYHSSAMDPSDSVNNPSSFHPQNDIFQNFSPKTAPPVLPRSKRSPDFHDVTLDTPDLFRTNHSSSLLNGNTPDRTEVTDSLFRNEPSTNPTNPFYSGSNYASSSKNSDKENQSPAFVQNNDIFNTNSNEKLDDFSAFSGSSSVDPFPTPLKRNIHFSSLEDPFADDPFADSPLKLSDPFQDASLDTSDVFSPVTPKTNEAQASEAHSSSPAPKTTSPTSDKPKEIVLTTPLGSQHSILQPTPLIQANSQSVSPSQSPKLQHVSTFRRPPKPLPRIRRSRTSVTSRQTPPEKPPKPERPSPPALPTLPTLEVSEPVEPDKSPAELASPKPPPKPPAPKLSPKPSIKPLLQKPVIRRKQKNAEQCVEDWPEDSPEVQPDFKPRGTLRLRRESLMSFQTKTDSETEDQEGPASSTKKKDKKSKMSSRRESKDQFSDEFTSRSRTNSSSRKSSKEYFTESPYSSQEIKKDDKDDPDQWVDYKKPHFKDKMNSLLRRSSAAAAFGEHKHMNGHDSKDREHKKGIKDPFRRHSEGTTLDGNSGESADDYELKKSRKLRRSKLLYNKGLAFNKDDPKGAHGYTHKGSKDEGLDEMKSQTLQSQNKAAYLNGEYSANGYDEDFDAEEQKPKSSKLKPLALPRKAKANHASPDHAGAHQEDFNQDEFEFEDIDELKGKLSAETYNHEEDELDISEPKKPFKLKNLKKKLKKKSTKEDLPGATSSDFTSEAAKAAFMAAEKDRHAMDDYEDEDEDGDTDSLMEWWNTVEQWDELPSDEEDNTVHEDESKSFSVLADKVHRGLRLFNKVFVERAEVLWQSVISLHALADDISTFHSKARIAGITGGTTTAVGSVAAIAGLALAPVTFGASLIVTAVGVGVATAGGITSASAAISDNVNNAQDRKKVETLLLENEVHLMELSKILHFSNTGLYKLRGHPFLRSGTQHYAQDWEVRRAVQMIGLVDTPVMKATDFIDSAVNSVQGLFKGMDKYFLKEGSRELKKGCKTQIVAEIKDVANILNDCIVELNGVREDLHDAIGDV